MSNEENYYENPQLWGLERYAAADLERVAELANKLPIEALTVLDVGCGNGLFLQHLSGMRQRHFTRLCGTDRSAAALSRVKAEKVHARIEALPFADREFDVVTCMEVLEHLPQTTYSCALKELSRIARQCIVVSVPANEQLRLSLTECGKCYCRFNPNYHLRMFDKPTMQGLFSDMGFKCCEVFYIHPERVVPPRVEATLRIVGMAKRAVLRQPRSPMRDLTVCPACGYSSAGAPEISPEVKVRVARTLGTRIRHLLCFQRSWRWIAAVYERMY